MKVRRVSQTQDTPATKALRWEKPGTFRKHTGDQMVWERVTKEFLELPGGNKLSKEIHRCIFKLQKSLAQRLFFSLGEDRNARV